MNSSLARLPCVYHGGCSRETLDPSRLCHRHKHLQQGYTRGGQLVFSSGGPIGATPRIAREKLVQPPQGDDSMEIEGFPYYSSLDHKRYVDWKINIGPRPSNDEVIDRYPITVNDIKGTEITGDEIGVYDNSGKFYSFDHEAPPQESSGLSGGEVRVFRMEDGTPFAINSDNVYQVVTFDSDKLGSHL